MPPKGNQQKHQLRVGQRVWIPNRSIYQSIQTGIVTKIEDWRGKADVPEILWNIYADVRLDTAGDLPAETVNVNATSCYPTEEEAVRVAVRHHKRELNLLLYRLDTLAAERESKGATQTGFIPTTIITPSGVAVW